MFPSPVPNQVLPRRAGVWGGDGDMGLVVGTWGSCRGHGTDNRDMGLVMGTWGWW